MQTIGKLNWFLCEDCYHTKVKAGLVRDSTALVGTGIQISWHIQAKAYMVMRQCIHHLALHESLLLLLQTSIGQGSEDRQQQEVGKKPIGIVTIEVWLSPLCEILLIISGIHCGMQGENYCLQAFGGGANCVQQQNWQQAQFIADMPAQ